MMHDQTSGFHFHFELALNMQFDTIIIKRFFSNFADEMKQMKILISVSLNSHKEVP